MIYLESAGLSEIGKKRSDNQDRMLVDDTLKLYAVADGMGGHQAGEVASQLMVDTLEAFFHSPGRDGFPLSRTIDKRLSHPANRLLNGIHLSNQLVYTSSQSNSAHRGMGTTVAAVHFTPHTVIAANVGDSPIFRIRKGAIAQISESHTLLAEQAALRPDLAERFGHGLGHVLTRAIGTHPRVQAAVFELDCIGGDIFVLSSDGLTDKASPEEIQAVVQTSRPQEACARLVALANDRGGDDNITIVVIKVKDVRQARLPARIWRSLLDKIR